jgi:hypothetical protein
MSIYILKNKGRKFLLLTMEEAIPAGYRLATVEDVTENGNAARAAIAQDSGSPWVQIKLKNGKIYGEGYGYKVESGSSAGSGLKLAVTGNHGKHKLVN